MFNSDSDDDFSWMPKAGAGKASGKDAMMEARREALRKQREQQHSSPLSAESTKAPIPGRLGGASLSGDAPLSPLNDHHNHEGNFQGNNATVGGDSSSQGMQTVKLDSIEALKVEIETKKKLLQSTKEREQALLNKWRTAKAKKTAEIHQADAQLRSLWGTIEDEKSNSDSKIREAQDAFEKEILTVRRNIEQEVKQEYEPKIEALKAKLQEKKEEEDKLKSLLNMEEETKDVIQQAVGAALTKVLDRIQNVFAESAADTDEWDKSLQELIQHEVRSSFAVSMDSEGQAEREEQKKQFDEMLNFWKEAEKAERERITKMDEMLLADLQTMTQQDISRLQQEEQMMENLYLESRQNWALEHQKILTKEVEGAMKRRQEELDEQRALRHQLHLDRLNDIDARHKEQVEMEAQLHEKAMSQLREHFAMQESLQNDRNRAVMAAEEDVAKASASLQGIVQNIESVIHSLKGYESKVEERREAVEKEKLESLSSQEKILLEIKELASSQYVSLEMEGGKLGESLRALELVKNKVEAQLRDEVMWLTQQEARYKANREEWEREYRRWSQTIQEQRRLGEERFSEALTALQKSMALLSQEEKDISVEEAALQRTFNNLNTTTEKEVLYLEEKKANLIKKQEAMSDTMVHLEQQKKQAAEHLKQLQKDRAALNRAKEELSQEELRLNEMLQSLDFAKSQIDSLRHQTIETKEFKQNLSRHIPDPSATIHTQIAQKKKSKHEKPHPHHSQKKDRLPAKVLTELRRQLEILPENYPSYGYNIGNNLYAANAIGQGGEGIPSDSRQPNFSKSGDKGVRRQGAQRTTSKTRKGNVHRDPSASIPHSDSQPLSSSYLEFSPSTVTNFTNLVNLSDNDSFMPY